MRTACTVTDSDWDGNGMSLETDDDDDDYDDDDGVKLRILGRQCSSYILARDSLSVINTDLSYVIHLCTFPLHSFKLHLHSQHYIIIAAN